MPAEHPQAVLFDMDGTLVDTEDLWWEATASVADALGRPLGPDDTPHVVGRTVEDTAAHLLSSRSARHASVAAQLTDAFAERLRRGITVMPGALELLDELTAAGIPTALVTASPRSVVEQVLPRLDSHRFDLVITAEDTARGKPYPDPYLTAAKRLGVDPKRCVAVEDSPAGVAAATAAGCRVVVVSTEAGLPRLRAMSLS